MWLEKVVGKKTWEDMEKAALDKNPPFWWPRLWRGRRGGHKMVQQRLDMWTAISSKTG